MTESVPFKGVGPALVTPMKADGSVDLEAFAGHVEFALEGGVDFLVPCGTTGESATLSPEEQATVIRRCVEVAAGQVPVLAGAGSNDTRVAASLARGAAEAGAQGVLVVTPYYNKPGLAGLIRHYRSVGQVGLPIVLYNVPGRTGSNVGPELVLAIADEVPQVVGVKESSGDLDPIMTLVQSAPSGFQILSGDDHLALAAVAVGAHGLISVVANEAPGFVSELVDAGLAGRMEEARELHYRLLPLMRANFLESNPAPVKAALALMGRISDDLRPPLAPVHPETRVALRKALARLGVPNLQETE